MNQTLLFSPVLAAATLAIAKLSRHQTLAIVLVGLLAPHCVFGYKLAAASGDSVSDIWKIALTSQEVTFVTQLDAGRGTILFGLAPLFILLTLRIIFQDPGKSQVEDLVKARLISILLAHTAAIGLISAGSMLNYIIFWPLLLAAGFLSLLGDIREETECSRSSAVAAYVSMALISCILVVGALTFLSIAVESFDPMVIKDNTIAKFSPSEQWWFLLVLFLGVGLLTPVFPVHAWIRVLGPVISPVTSIILFGITGKLGLVVLVVCGTLLPNAFVSFRQALLIAGVFTTIYMAIAAYGAASEVRHPYLVSAYGGVMLILLAEFSQISMTGFAYGVLTLPYSAYYLSMLTKCPNTRSAAPGESAVKEEPALCITSQWLAAVTSLGVGALLPGSSGFVWLVLTAIALVNRLSAAAVLAAWIAINGAFVIHHRRDLVANAARSAQAKPVDYALMTLIILAHGIFPTPLIQGVSQWVQTIVGQ